MTDFIDNTTDREQAITEAVVNNRVIYRGVSPLACVDCDEPIPEKRRLLLPGVKTCVHCAQIEELRR